MRLTLKENWGNVQILENMAMHFHNNSQIIEITKNIRKYFELNKNETITLKIYYRPLKYHHSVKFITTNAHMRKEEISQIYNPSFEHRKLE